MMTNNCPACGHIAGSPFEICERCGVVVAKFLTRKEVEAKEKEQQEAPVRCPNCQSAQISVDKKGFGLGKAAAGALLLGPVGLLGGFVGSKKVMLTCIKCGHQWNIQS